MRQSRAKALLLGATGACALLLTLSAVFKPPTLLLWNASRSVPVGLYGVTPGAVRKGDMAVAWMPSAMRPLAAKRRYLPAAVPLVKRVAAAEGDRVCALEEFILIDGTRVVRRLRADPSGRPMPWWNGCRILGRGEVLLLAPGRLSFDGRYFGATAAADILGRADLLWAP